MKDILSCSFGIIPVTHANSQNQIPFSCKLKEQQFLNWGIHNHISTKFNTLPW